MIHIRINMVFSIHIKFLLFFIHDALEILKTIPENSIDCLVTDPPYFISQEKKDINRKYLSGKENNIKLDFGEWDRYWENENEFFKWTEEWFKEVVRVLKQGAWLYIAFDKNKIGIFDLYLAPKYNIKSRTIFVWCKTNPTPSFRKVNWVSATEFIWVGSKGESKLSNFHKQTEMFNYMLYPNKSSYGKTSHPTEKPLKLFEKFILASTNEGDIVQRRRYSS